MIFLRIAKKKIESFLDIKYTIKSLTRPEIYPEFNIHLSTLTRGLNAQKYGNFFLVIPILSPSELFI